MQLLWYAHTRLPVSVWLRSTSLRDQVSHHTNCPDPDRSSLVLMPRTEDPYHFFDLAFGYYITGRFAAINRLCIAPDLMHHAIELLIKFTLLKNVPESQRSAGTTDLG